MRLLKAYKYSHILPIAFLLLTQPNGHKVCINIQYIVAMWAPPAGVCSGATQIVTGQGNFCVTETMDMVLERIKTETD